MEKQELKFSEFTNSVTEQKNENLTTNVRNFAPTRDKSEETHVLCASGYVLVYS